MSIVLKKVDGYTFSIDGYVVRKDAIEVVQGSNSVRFTFVENGVVMEQYKDKTFSDFADGDNLTGDPLAPTVFATVEALKEYINAYVLVYHPVAVPFRLISDASVNATYIKQGLAILESLSVYNAAETDCYFKIYDDTDAPTGADEPISTYYIPKGKHDLVLSPIQFYKGLGFRITTDIADADETAVGVNDVVVNIAYR